MLLFGRRDHCQEKERNVRDRAANMDQYLLSEKSLGLAWQSFPDAALPCRKPPAAAIARGQAGVQGRGGERGAHRLQRGHGGRGQPPTEAGEERKGAGRDRAKAAATRRKNRWGVTLKAVLTGVQDTEDF